MFDDDFKRLLFDLPPAPHCPTCGDATYSVYTRQLAYTSFDGVQVIPLRVCTFCARTLAFHDAALEHTKETMRTWTGPPLPSSLGLAVQAYERSLRDG